MEIEYLVNIAQAIVFTATPLVIAGIGETLTERSGVVNLSLDGSIIISALAGFAFAILFESLILAVLIGMAIGMIVALFIAYFSIRWNIDQIVVGFVLTLLLADLAQTLGQNFTRVPGERIPHLPIPMLDQIPILGQILFDQDILVYISFALVIGSWFWIFKTRYGLELRAVGENPEAAHARGINVNKLRYFYTGLGGALVGLSGVSYSLNVKAGWTTPPSILGFGWIVLAIVIFAGWHPFRIAFGAYLFSALSVLTIVAQREQSIPFPSVLIGTFPWILMISVLALTSSGFMERLTILLPDKIRYWSRNILRSDAPAGLGKRFSP